MPVKLGSKLPQEPEARIEIIPLIDIMFFLLASFMLVSLSMVNMKSVPVKLPTATTAQPDHTKDFVDISVDKAGSAFLDTKRIGLHELADHRRQMHDKHADLRVVISADRDAHHGDVIHVLDAVRAAGIDKVAFDIRPDAQGAQP